MPVKEEHDKGKADKRPFLAYVAGAIGLILTLSLIGFIAREAWMRSDTREPDIVVETTEISPVSSGFVVAFEARNRTGATASGVEIEAEHTVAGADPTRASVTIDYLPGHSTVKGGIFLPADPGKGRLTLRALGYTHP